MTTYRTAFFTMPLTIVEYDPKWPELFEQEKLVLLNLLQDNCIEIQHFGSTSVPGMCAKPIIDLRALVKEMPSTQIMEELLSLGYKERGRSEPENYIRFDKGDPIVTSMLHILTESFNNGEPDPTIVMRDYLRSHPEEIKRYSEVKRELAKKESTTMLDYRDGKHDIVQELLDKSKEWWKDMYT